LYFRYCENLNPGKLKWWNKLLLILHTHFYLVNYNLRDCAAGAGYFMEYIDCEYGVVYHKIYVHQKYIRLFIVDTYVKLKESAGGGLVLKLKYPSLNSSDDMIISNPTPYKGGNW